MPTGIVSAVVFVANPGAAMLTADMFDEQALCDDFGDLEKESQIKAGPIGQFRYSRGIYEFFVAPDRIDIRCRMDSLLPDTLIVGARKIATVLDPVKRAAAIAGVGINCDAVFRAQEIGRTNAAEWCQSLLDQPAAFGLLGHRFVPFLTCVFRLSSSPVQYSVRLEPDAQSSGADLSVAVNGHQNVEATRPLWESLDAAQEVREQVVTLHERISRLAKGA